MVASEDRGSLDARISATASDATLQTASAAALVPATAAASRRRLRGSGACAEEDQDVCRDVCPFASS